MTKGCSSYCHPGFILLALHTAFRFTERRQREIQLSMVGSCRTWNKDEPGLGRPRALPSSLPCRVAVIWMVLSGRHMSMSTCTQAIAHSVVDARHLRKSTTLPQRSLCVRTPDHHHLLMFPGLLFLSSPLLSPGPL